MGAEKTLFIGWTTLGRRDDAGRLAETLVAERLAACAQVEGPVVSHYVWRDAAERTEEYRVTLKFVGTRAADLERRLRELHPYSVPQWVAVRADIVGADYLKWVAGD